MKTSIIYENLRMEMGKRRLSLIDISEATGIDRNVLTRNLSGKRRLLLDEACKIQKTCFPDCRMMYLFEEVA